MKLIKFILFFSCTILFSQKKIDIDSLQLKDTKELFGDDYGNIYLYKAKEALVTVGILPNPAKQYLVKRVIGVGGDNVQCCSKNGKLLINGKESNETYVFAGNKPSDMKFNVTVPEGKLWVMGDHRGASADSRYHQDDINKGFVPESEVVGRVVAVIWPFKNAKLVDRVNALH